MLTSIFIFDRGFTVCIYIYIYINMFVSGLNGYHPSLASILTASGGNTAIGIRNVRRTR